MQCVPCSGTFHIWVQSSWLVWALCSKLRPEILPMVRTEQVQHGHNMCMWQSLQTTDLRSKCIHNFDSVNSWLLKKQLTLIKKSKLLIMLFIVPCQQKLMISSLACTVFPLNGCLCTSLCWNKEMQRVLDLSWGAVAVAQWTTSLTMWIHLMNDNHDLHVLVSYRVIRRFEATSATVLVLMLPSPKCTHCCARHRKWTVPAEHSCQMKVWYVPGHSTQIA